MEYRSTRLAVAARPSPEIALYFDSCYSLHGVFETAIFKSPMAALMPKEDKYPDNFLLGSDHLGPKADSSDGPVVGRALQILSEDLQKATGQIALIQHGLETLSVYDTRTTTRGGEVQDELVSNGFSETFIEDLTITAVTALFREKGIYTVPVYGDQASLYPWSQNNSLDEGVELALLDLPLVRGASVQWEQAKELRSDSEARASLRDLRLFLDGLDASKGKDFVQDTLLSRVEQYEIAAKKHGFELEEGPIEALLRLRHLPKVAALGLVAALMPGFETAAIAAAVAAPEFPGAMGEIGNLLMKVRKKRVLQGLGGPEQEVEYLIKVKEGLQGQEDRDR